MLKAVKASVLAFLALTLLLGLAFPLLVTGIGQVAFPGGSEGSLLKSGGQVVGSRLIGQSFEGEPGYFQSRPSATGYAADATAFSNAGPNSKDQYRALKKEMRSFLQLERPFSPDLDPASVPAGAVTRSASGVDPHISEANATIQARRVARVRDLPLSRVLDLIDQNTDGASLGIFGEPAVNVLELNLDLDREY